MPGWPITFPSTGYSMAGNLLVDIDGDGLYEVVVGTGSGLSVYDYQGNLLWSVSAGRVSWRPSAADVDADGRREIAFVDALGRGFLVDDNGSVMPGWPVSLGDNPKTPVFWDLDGDGQLEVIIGQRAYPNGKVSVFKLDGSLLWERQLDYMCVATPSVGDVDADGDYEVVAVSYYSLYIFGPDGTQELALQNQWGGQSYAQPSLYDADGDGDLEIAVTFYTNAEDSVAVFQHDGTRLWARALGGPQAYTTPAPLDALEDGGGDLELLDASNHVSPTNDFHLFDPAGSELPGWPVQVQNITESTPTAFDFDGDRELEFLMPNNGTPGGLFVFNLDGSQDPGSPYSTQGPAMLSAPHIADVDADGDPEICLMVDPNPVYVNLWTLDGVKWRRYLAPYPMRFHDLWATGWAHPQRPSGLVATDQGGSVLLSWSPNPEPDLAGYFVYRRTPSTDWELLGFTQTTSYTDSNPPGGTVLYGVTAYIKGDVESYMDTTEVSLALREEPREIGFAAVPGGLKFWGQGVAKVYSADGRLAVKVRVEGEAWARLAPGVYAVSFGGKKGKAIVR